jgi:hypothetical protein
MQLISFVPAIFSIGFLLSAQDAGRGGPSAAPAARAMTLLIPGFPVVLQKMFWPRAEPIADLSRVDCSTFQSESFPDELNLPQDIPFRQPPHLAFPDHVQNFVALNRSPRSIERSKSLAGIHPPLDRSMILLHNIV